MSEKTLRDISRSIDEYTEAKIDQEIIVVHVGNMLRIRVVFEGTETPCFAYGRACICVADEDRKLSPTEAKQFFLEKGRNEFAWDSELPERNPHQVDSIDEQTMKEFI